MADESMAGPMRSRDGLRAGTARPVAERTALAVLVAGFAFGATKHAMDFWQGLAPYRHGPGWANLYWDALVGLDAVTALMLLSGRRRAGLVLATAVMVSDVAINLHVWRLLGTPGFAVAVPMQAAFLGFLLGSLGWLWPLAIARDGGAA